MTTIVINIKDKWKAKHILEAVKLLKSVATANLIHSVIENCEKAVRISDI